MRHFVSRYASEANKSITTIAAEAMDALANWNWPGNVRELQNLIQRWVILTESTVLRVPKPLVGGSTPPGAPILEVCFQ